MSRHNYTNPAFCQNSEFYPSSVSSVHREQDHQQSFYNRSLNFSTSSASASASGSATTTRPVKNARDGPLRIQRSVSTRSFRTLSHKNTPVERRFDATSPPRPGPKPGVHLNRTTGPFESRSGSGRYALVPVEELPSTRKDRYAIVPGPEPSDVVTPRRFVKSQDNLDRYSHLPIDNGPSSMHEEESSEQYTSLPPISMYEEQPRMKPAFSSDFGSKTFVLVDQKSNQRYAMVPTAEDEELVDDNHEIIQMHNGRAHRYAVIPTEDEEETCLSTSDLNQSHSNHDPASRTPLQTSTPQKGTMISSYPNTPLKNPAATRKLHELLSTPRKTPIKRTMSTPRHSNPNTPRYYQSQQIYPSHPERKKELSPHRLQYECPQQMQRHAQVDSRTTAVIQPRVAMAVNPGDESLNKTWDSSYPQKVANATATLAVVSLMLILGSAMNSGLCIYMIAHMGKSFYLQFSLAAAFCGVGLGFLGFRSRHSEWLPNRSYTSGYVLVTLFCLLKCCGLLVLLALDPYPGFALHDVTTGVILGLSAFTIFFIGLGVVGSFWCYRPPPDNRVNVVY